MEDWEKKKDPYASGQGAPSGGLMDNQSFMGGGGMGNMPQNGIQTSVGSMISNLANNGISGGNLDQFMSSPYGPQTGQPNYPIPNQGSDTGSVAAMNSGQQQQTQGILNSTGGNNQISQWQQPQIDAYQSYLEQRAAEEAAQAKGQVDYFDSSNSWYD